jgi:hypothetical protein
LKDVQFADGGELSVFVGEKTAFSLLGELENGEVHVISSPASGTSYSVDDLTVAEVDGNGLLVGLTEGVTTLTAANGGLWATINVAVARNAGGDNPNDPVNPVEPGNPDDGHGGSGCDASILGFGALAAG